VNTTEIQEILDSCSSPHVDWGYTDVTEAQSFDHFDEWLKLGKHGGLKYLSDHRKDLRDDLSSVFPNCQSALVFLFSYAEQKHISDDYVVEKGPKLSGYVTGFDGKDYHFVIGSYLEEIAEKLSANIAGLGTKLTLDIHPVLERDLAYRAGLGWFGKNSMLIGKAHGSYTLIGSILLDQKLEIENVPFEVDHCGRCKACAEACPTLAIDPETRTIEANKCISNYTIETFKDVAPLENHQNSNGEVFGCDICQEVCPWNKKQCFDIDPMKIENFEEKNSLIMEYFYQGSMEDSYLKFEKLSNRGFKDTFKFTPIARTGKKGLLKNFRSLMSASQ
jgi:epoxyqueuosine reductase